MGVLDMLNLLNMCMADGILSMLGAVYCSAPDFMYLKGMLAMSEFLNLLLFTIDPPLLSSCPVLLENATIPSKSFGFYKSLPLLLQRLKNLATI